MNYTLYFIIILITIVKFLIASPVSTGTYYEQVQVNMKNKQTHTQSHKGKQSPGTLTLEEAKDYALCTYNIVNDTNEKRFPKTIQRIVCRHKECSCMEGFKCAQLWRDMQVKYNDKREVTISVEHLCVCAQEQQVIENTNKIQYNGFNQALQDT